MAETKKKAAASTKSSAKAGAPRRSSGQAPKTTTAKAKTSKTTSGSAIIASASGSLLTLGAIKPASGSWPKRTRVGRGHGSGMVKTGGEGGKGQTVRSGGGKGPAFEGGQTPFARRLPQKLGVSQKARDIGHFRTHYAVLNLWELADWDASLEINPQTLASAGKVKQVRDGIKILGGTREGKTLPQGLVFRDIEFSGSAREALSAAGARFEE